MVRTQQQAIHLVVIAALATIAYWPVFSAGFVYDDHALVEAIEAYHTFDLERMVLGLGNGLEYLPVRDLTLALDAAAWGKNPLGYHLSNFLWFLLLLAVLYRAVLALASFQRSGRAGRIAFIATLIFALHPLNTEAVSFVAARNNIIALLFILVSALGFLGGMSGRRGGFALSLLAFALALFSKARTVFYPGALILLYGLLMPPGIQRKRDWLALVALSAMAIAGAATHVYIAGQTGISQPELARYGVGDLGTSLVRAALVPVFYLRYFVFPWPQSVSYDEIALLEWAQVGVAAALYGAYLVAFALAFRLRRQEPLLLAGLCWFYAALVPVSNIFPTFPFVADRYLFPGMAGLTLIVGATVAHLPRRAMQQIVLAGLAAVLLILTLLRNQAWQSDLSLWEATWRVTPRTGAHAYFNALLQNGQEEKAVELAAAENPRTYRYTLVRCELLIRQAEYAEALQACREALSLSAGYSATVRQQIHLAMGRTHEGLGKVLDAVYHYLQVLQEDSASMRLFFMDEAEAAVTRLRGQLEPREAVLRKAAEQQPASVRAQGEFGLFLLRTGRYSQASGRLQQASALQPDNWQISYNLGLAAAQSGDLERAHIAFGRVPRGEPAHAEGFNQLARLYSRQGEAEAALDYWQQAVAAQPANRNYRYNLARHYLRLGSRDLAREVLEAGLANGPESDRAFYRQVMENLGV